MEIKRISLTDRRGFEVMARGAIGFDAVKHLVLCRIERRPPRLDPRTGSMKNGPAHPNISPRIIGTFCPGQVNGRQPADPAIVLICGSSKNEEFMDRDRVKGVWNKAKGAVKKSVGRVTGDSKTEAEGRRGLTGASYLGAYRTVEPYTLAIAGPWFAPTAGGGKGTCHGRNRCVDGSHVCHGSER
jgi:CsbD-like